MSSFLVISLPTAETPSLFSYKIQAALDNGNGVRAASLDFSFVLDRVGHLGFLYSLEIWSLGFYLSPDF